MGYLFDLNHDDERIVSLRLADSRMAQLISVIGPLAVTIQTDAFKYLVKSLIGQQLSVKAAETIFRRVEQTCGGVSPRIMLSVSEETLRHAGVSKNKVRYIKELAMRIQQEEIHFDGLSRLDDEEVIGTLMKIKGIGRWTAEMFLIFYFGREDVFSSGDAGLRRAAVWLYKEEADFVPEELERHSRRWEPYRTLASLYLWEAINRGHVDAGPFPLPNSQI